MWLEKLKFLKRDVLMLRSFQPSPAFWGEESRCSGRLASCGVPLGRGVQVGPAVSSLPGLVALGSRPRELSAACGDSPSPRGMRSGRWQGLIKEDGMHSGTVFSFHQNMMVRRSRVGFVSVKRCIIYLSVFDS